SALSTAPSLTDTYTLSLHDALPISVDGRQGPKVFLPVDLRHVGGQVIEFSQALQLFAAQAIRKLRPQALLHRVQPDAEQRLVNRSEEHTSELQSRENLVCRLLLEKK